MALSREEQIDALHRAALQRDERERPAFLAQACGRDQALRRDVESLLAVESRQIGPYRVVSLLGAGGMGEVYRAHDPQLGRDVAIKVLPPAFVAEPERLARFEREARLLAALSHPNIATIYSIEQTDAGRALVLELVEGPTLAECLEAGPMPVDDALSITRQIAEALEAAHEKGVLHRDLKPANIKLTADGRVKVLDFGLAKLMDTEAAGAVPAGYTHGLANSPTITAPAMTGPGVILGTAAYMSPEQAKGKPADKRSDIWAFGVVLYEMLTGNRLFEGETTTETLAAVIGREPQWDKIPQGCSPCCGGVSKRIRRSGCATSAMRWRGLSRPTPPRLRPCSPIAAAGYGSGLPWPESL
jgi:serine/threonine protein kinase